MVLYIIRCFHPRRNVRWWRMTCKYINQPLTVSYLLFYTSISPPIWHTMYTCVSASNGWIIKWYKWNLRELWCCDARNDVMQGVIEYCTGKNTRKVNSTLSWILIESLNQSLLRPSIEVDSDFESDFDPKSESNLIPSLNQLPLPVSHWALRALRVFWAFWAFWGSPSQTCSLHIWIQCP